MLLRQGFVNPSNPDKGFVAQGDCAYAFVLASAFYTAATLEGPTQKLMNQVFPDHDYEASFRRTVADIRLLGIGEDFPTNIVERMLTYQFKSSPQADELFVISAYFEQAKSFLSHYKSTGLPPDKVPAGRHTAITNLVANNKKYFDEVRHSVYRVIFDAPVSVTTLTTEPENVASIEPGVTRPRTVANRSAPEEVEDSDDELFETTVPDVSPTQPLSKRAPKSRPVPTKAAPASKMMPKQTIQKRPAMAPDHTYQQAAKAASSHYRSQEAGVSPEAPSPAPPTASSPDSSTEVLLTGVGYATALDPYEARRYPMRERLKCHGLAAVDLSSSLHTYI